MVDESSSIKAKFCGNCGQKLLDGATFCAYCGSKIPSIASSSPSSPIPPRITSPAREISDYQTQYQQPQHPVKLRYEPPLPFIKNFQGVLLSPKKEMSQISKRANFRQPFLIVILCGILAGIALYISLLKIDIQVSNNFSDPFGMLESGLYTADEIIDIYPFILLVSSPIYYIINWIVQGLILWILLALISSNISSQERTFKIGLTIVGWSFLPRIFNEVINAIANFIFIEPETVVVENFSELSNIGIQSGLFWDILSWVNIIFLIWGSVIVYFALRDIDAENSHAILITVIYTVVPIVFSLFGFVLLT